MPGATGNYGPAPKRSLADRLDDAAVGMLPLETPGSHFAKPADSNPRVNHPAPFAKTAADEVRPVEPLGRVNKKMSLVSRRASRSRR